MIVVRVTNSLAIVIANKAFLLETDTEKIETVHYKPSADSDTQVTRQKAVEAKNDHVLKLC